MDDSRSGGVGRGCLIAVLVGLAAVFILPILLMIVIRIFGHKVDLTLTEIQQRLDASTSHEEPRKMDLTIEEIQRRLNSSAAVKGSRAEQPIGTALPQSGERP